MNADEQRVTGRRDGQPKDSGTQMPSPHSLSRIETAWLDDVYPGKGITFRDDLARQFDCDPAEVESRLAARAKMDAYAAERAEDADPYGYQRQRVRYGRVERMMNDERTV
jgi:hypothetical protein